MLVLDISCLENSVNPGSTLFSILNVYIHAGNWNPASYLMIIGEECKQNNIKNAVKPVLSSHSKRRPKIGFQD